MKRKAMLKLVVRIKRNILIIITVLSCIAGAIIIPLLFSLLMKLEYLSPILIIFLAIEGGILFAAVFILFYLIFQSITDVVKSVRKN